MLEDIKTNCQHVQTGSVNVRKDTLDVVATLFCCSYRPRDSEFWIQIHCQHVHTMLLNVRKSILNLNAYFGFWKTNSGGLLQHIEANFHHIHAAPLNAGSKSLDFPLNIL